LFACALDFDASFTAAGANSFDRRLSDDVSTFNYYQQKGSFSGWKKFEELSAVVAGKAPGRKNNKEKILAANLGLGIYDVVVARRVTERARERGLGTMLQS
jgi:ornithine cyclodeaminase/alanine dehydrogenase-like protein (mu-crystallin family)